MGTAAKLYIQRVTRVYIHDPVFLKMTLLHTERMHTQTYTAGGHGLLYI